MAETTATPQRIVLASDNPGKVREFNQLLAEQAVQVLPQAYFGIPQVEENGLSFVENALIKARNAARHSGLPAIADDSGLEVDALDGAPGIHSNRYAGEGASDRDRIEKLLSELPDSNKSARTARFRCALAICEPTGGLEVFEGRCDGWISLLPLGSNGFGYDPVFIVPELEKTMAELDPTVIRSPNHPRRLRLPRRGSRRLEGRRPGRPPPRGWPLRSTTATPAHESLRGCSVSAPRFR